MSNTAGKCQSVHHLHSSLTKMGTICIKGLMVNCFPLTNLSQSSLASSGRSTTCHPAREQQTDRAGISNYTLGGRSAISSVTTVTTWPRSTSSHLQPATTLFSTVVPAHPAQGWEGRSWTQKPCPTSSPLSLILCQHLPCSRTELVFHSL